MTLDLIDSSALNLEQKSLGTHLNELHQGFKSRLSAENGFFQSFTPEVDKAIARSIGIDDVAAVAALRPDILKATDQLLNGVEREGFHTLGLKEISKWKVNPEYRWINIKQQSGYAAEVISTYKENLIAKANGTGITTYRADDLPEMFKRNDQFVDKVRINADGQIVDRIQSKFFGKNGQEWVSKMMSKDCDKYFNGDVNKIECPRNYYDNAMAEIPKKRDSLQRQIDHVLADGKTDVAENLNRQIDKLNQLEKMTEKSTVSTHEAIFARLLPEEYAAKGFIADMFETSNSEGLKNGVLAAGITFTTSAVENISSYLNGQITVNEMVKDVLKDTVAAGALGYGTTFITNAASELLKKSSTQLLKTVGGSCLPAAIVSFAVESYENISKFFQGKITGAELAVELGDNASAIAGGTAGAQYGAIMGGTLAGPIGAAAGSIVGGMIGCAIASEAYKTAIELGTAGAELLSVKAAEYAKKTVAAVFALSSDHSDSVKDAFNDFFQSSDIAISI